MECIIRDDACFGSDMVTELQKRGICSKHLKIKSLD